MKLAALLVGVVACTKAEPREPPKPDPPVPTPTPTKSVDNDRWLALVGHTNTAASATYLAVEMATDRKAPPKLVPLDQKPALAMSHWPGHFHAVAAHHGDRWAWAGEANGAYRVTVGLIAGAVGGKTTRSFAVPFEPASLHLTDGALFVGGKQSVGWIDVANLTAADQKYVELANRDHQFKAYDLFVRDGDRLLAIDDEVMPMYADWFALDGTGKPTKRLGDWKMPGVINGHYAGAALLATAPNEWTLYTYAPYSIMSGSGQDLVALPIRNDKLVFDPPDLTLQNANGKVSILEEHEARGARPGPVLTLLAGTELTQWTGIALARGAKKVLFAGGKRGLMIVPANFTATTKATLLDLGGDVLDIRDQGGQIYALVTDQLAGELVVLDADVTKVIARHKLPARFDRFVD